MGAGRLPIYYPACLVRITANVFKSLRTRETDEAVFFVRPRSVSLERNTYTEADACTLEFSSAAFPVLPRNISEALIQVYIGDTGELQDDAAGIADDSLLRFIGYIDRPEMNLSEKEASIRWKARDYTALLLDIRRPLTSTVPAFNDNLKDALRRILDSVPGGTNIQLALEGLDEWPELSIAAPPGAQDAKIPVRPEDTLWHYVKRACDPVSMIPEFRLDTLVVHPSRGLTSATRRPYFVFGGNLSEWHESRDLARMKEGIGLTALDMSTGKFIVSVYPPSGDTRLQAAGRKTAAKKHSAKSAPKPVVGSAGAVVDPKDKRKWFPYGPVQNQEALDAAAQRIFNERSRQEFEGSFVCRRMAVTEDGNVDDLDADTFDVLSLTSGDRILVDIWPNHRAILGGFDTTATRVSYLVDRGYDPSVATALVDAFEGGVDGPLEVYLRKMTLEVSEQGFAAKIDFQNLIDGSMV